ncbi:unnamed protein product, partial [Oppiella nova]
MKVLIVLAVFGLIYYTSAVPLTKRDIKEDLLKRATDLEKAGQDFSKKLRDEGKKVEADVVDKE